MTVGLLLCDHLDDDVVEEVGDYTELYPAAFGPAGVELRIYDVVRGELPASTDECDGWITSGSRHSSYDDHDWIAQLADFQRRLVAERRPQVGICFGHQLLARTLGGEVERAEVGWGVGVRSFDVVGDSGVIGPTGGRFRLLMSHRDQVTRLPDGAELLARADYCPVGAYRVGDHVLCVQGHPEFVPRLSELLLHRRRDVIGDEVADAALATLDGPVDHDRVIGCIAAFLGS